MSLVFSFKQKTAYDMRISDWISDVCSSALTCATTAAQTRLLDHVDYLFVRKLLAQNLAPCDIATGLEIVLVRPWGIKMQRRVDDVVFLRCGPDCHLLRPHFSAARIRSTVSVSRFS